MNDKKHILIVSFFFQPYNTIASVRVSYLAKYLQDKGYVIHVITAKRYRNLNLNVGEIRNVNYVWWPNADKLLNLSNKYPKNRILYYLSRTINKILTPSVTTLPEGGVSIWRFFAYRKAKEIIKKNKIDLIYTSSGPASSAIVGSKLTEKFGIPWIPEFRDLWSMNIYRNNSQRKKKKQLKIEEKYVKKSRHIITVTKGFARILSTIYSKYNIPITHIYNGYLFYNKEQTYPSEKLSIVHLGTIYPQKRDPSILFSALQQLKEQEEISKKDIVIKFYGTGNNYIKELVDKYNIHDFVEIHKSVDYNTAIDIQKNSSILLLLQWNNENDYAIPGKLFEYIGMKRPVLAICYPGEIKTILETTSTGTVINDTDKMKEFLLYAINNYKKNPLLGFEFKENEIKKFSRDYQFERLEQIINREIS